MVSLQQNALFIRLMFLGLHAYVGKFCLIPGASGRPKIAAVSRNAPAWIAELCPGQPAIATIIIPLRIECCSMAICVCAIHFSHSA